ncbi:MAG TPA: hypothetical protein RMF84_05630 [Polyangiaceae bacterium LLY-WYZ-14_1]|nr:hypothetical protein [Polyangiaceae bacterium LLY-WYZ-14_1]
MSSMKRMPPDPMPNLELSTDVGRFFEGRLAAAIEERRASPSPWARSYLARLLVRYAGRASLERFREPLCLRLGEALDPDGPSTSGERFEQLRAIGDDALYLCGFFDPWLAARGLEAGYVAGLGGQAYLAASELRRGGGEPAEGYRELARDFRGLAEVLEDVREQTSMRTPQDIVRLYDRFRRAPSARLARRLRSAGVLLPHRETPTRGGEWLH